MEFLYYNGSVPSTTGVVSYKISVGSSLFAMENLPFNVRVKRARDFAAKTQEELALACGISQKHIERMENRKDGRRSYYTAQIAAACGVSAHWLATGEGQMVTPKDLPEDALAIAAAWHFLRGEILKDRHTADLLSNGLNFLPVTHPLYRTAAKLYRDAAKRRGIKMELGVK